ncbi:DUF4983 domain-containing protein [Arachidicoccus sp.]|uniref:DUF4983 domain-containing protein n=1 Tax=Arachidicoccus sp. TaxID=1872624 RepID=UPI003D21D419
MKLSWSKYNKWCKTLFVAAMGGIVLSSCNKGVTNLLGEPNKDFGKDTSNVILGIPKVLYIIIDGARGEAIRDLAPQNLLQIAKSSVYTYNSLDNAANINAISWTDMLTGVDSSKHKVRSADFTNNDINAYPSIFTRLKVITPNSRTATFVRSQLLNDNLLTDADVHQVLSSDEDAVSATVNELNQNDPSLVMVELNNVDSVGKQNSYQSDDVAYAQAIQQADNEVGVLLNAIQSRPSFTRENWLVVIASGKGGPLPYTVGTDTTLYNNSKGNGFIYFYNPKFTLSFYAKPDVIPYVGAAPIYTGSFVATTPSATTADYDINAITEMTISFKLKMLQYGTLNPGIVVKTGSSANSYNGWWFCHNGSNGSIRFVVRGSGGTHSGTNNTLTTTAGYQVLNEWHTYTGKVYFGTDSKRYMQLYADGLPVNATPIDISNLDATANHTANNITTDFPLGLGLIGSYAGGTTKEMVTDLKIFNIALPDYVIAENACKLGVDSTSPYFSHLIGYWSGTDADGQIVKDFGPKGNDMSFKNPPSSIWNPFSDASNNVCPSVSSAYLNANPKGLDIPYQIYQWLGVNISSSWGLDGRSWPANYNLKQN